MKKHDSYRKFSLLLMSALTISLVSLLGCDNNLSEKDKQQMRNAAAADELYEEEEEEKNEEQNKQEDQNRKKNDYEK